MTSLYIGITYGYVEKVEAGFTEKLTAIDFNFLFFVNTECQKEFRKNFYNIVALIARSL